MEYPSPSILLMTFNSDPRQRQVMHGVLEVAGYILCMADDIPTGLEMVANRRPCLVIIDLCLEDVAQRKLLAQIAARHKSAQTLLLTDANSAKQLSRLVRLGAGDYLHKPFSAAQFSLAVYKALAPRASREGAKTGQPAKAARKCPLLLGDSSKIQIVKALIRRMAPSDASVLLLGESGTGKELAARLLHYHSKRCAGPFVAVNCAAIPPTLLESELFGHIRGAFSGAVRDHPGKFQQANEGTLFLDEVGELPPELQPKLLRALQEHEVSPVGGSAKPVDVRLIAATNCDLENLVAAGHFRSDLFYRLAVLPLKMPALRDRPEDIVPLARFFLEKKAGNHEVSLSSGAVKTLQEYPWPGNVRELQNLMERLAILDQKGLIEREDLPSHLLLGERIKNPCVVRLPPEGFPLKDIERQAIMQALVASSGNLTRAAAFLRVPRHILAYRINKYAMEEVS